MIACHPVIGEWVAAKCECPMPTEGATAIGMVKDGKIVAGVMYERFTGRSIVASIAIEPKTVMERKFVWAIFDYPFNQLGVERIVVFLNTSNKASAKLAKHMGFVPVTVVPGIYIDGDMAIYEAVRQNCKWLEKDYGIEVKDTESA